MTRRSLWSALQREAVNDLERSFALEDMVWEGVKTVDDILDRARAEREQAIAFEQTFDYYERLDDRYGVALRRRNELLELFEIYRVGLGEQLRVASDQVIEGEFKEVKTPEIAAPSVTPSAEPHLMTSARGELRQIGVTPARAADRAVKLERRAPARMRFDTASHR